jgi:hypothetical protein
MAAKKARLLELLREERGVSQPERQAPAERYAPTVPKPEPVAPPAAPPSNEAARLFAEFQAQQKAAQDAVKAAEERIKAAAEREAAVEAKDKKLQMSLTNPLEYIAEAGMTAEQWQEFLTGPGELSPEQKRVREAEKMAKSAMDRAEALEKSIQNERKQMQVQAERAQIEAQLPQYPLTRKMGGAQAVQARVEELSKQAGKPVTWQQAAQHLENEFFTGLSALLQDPEIAGKVNISVSKPKSESAAPNNPTTLGRATAPTSGASKPANPRDFAAKKAAYLELLRKTNLLG